MEDIMKAIQIKRTGTPEVLEYADVERPSPGAGQVRVKVISASVNYADTMMRRGVYPAMPPLPVILGAECSGVVDSVGEGVTGFQPGQRVALTGTQGCYAEYVVANAEMVFPIPDELDMDVAAVFPAVYLTAYHMLHSMAHVEAGQTVLIYAAAGGMGTALIQLGKLAGLTTVGLTSSARKVQFAKEQGIDHIINYKTENVAARIKQITDGRGVDLILNSVAGDTFSRDFEILAPMGMIIWYGLAAGLPKMNMTERLASGFMNSLGIRTFSVYNIFQKPELLAQSAQKMIQYLTEGQIKPHIHERIPLAEAARAHELLEGGAVMGKLILKSTV
jgi:NADPH2:quinone reductase